MFHEFPNSEPAIANSGTGVTKKEHHRPPSEKLDAQPRITIFAIPKAFEGAVGLIQRNAIRSWARLQPRVDVLLIGQEAGIAEVAAELGVRHCPHLKCNSQGTPLVSDAFETVQRNSSSPILVYCNCDVILLKSFVKAIERICDEQLNSFVAFGRRTDLHVDQEIHFDNRLELESLLTHCHEQGQPSSVVCKEYFAFTRGVYDEVPPFAVGRGNWDNWMIHAAKVRHVPVIDISQVAIAIHQSHDYGHLGGSRWRCYVDGSEALENQRLGGGRHLISGSTPTHVLNDRGIRKLWFSRWNLAFWADFPRFVGLLNRLLRSR